jgi:hypothetical protein
MVRFVQGFATLAVVGVVGLRLVAGVVFSGEGVAHEVSDHRCEDGL